MAASGTLVLASASPRRRALLRAAGIACDVMASGVEERPEPGESPRDYCQRVAADKAADVAARLPSDARPILAADTIVVVDGVLLEKPASADDASRMLRLLSGRVHAVLTGVCLVDRSAGRRMHEVVQTEVAFTEMSEREITDYVATGEPMDKAGAYAIQGRASRFVERINGDYFNVVGLPVPTVYRLLKHIGFISDGR